MSLFSLPLMLNAQSVDEMLQKVSAAIEAGQQGQAMSYFRQTISLNIDRTEMYYWTNIDKSSEISVKLANELAIAFRKKRNYDKAYLFYKELLQKNLVQKCRYVVGRKRMLCECMRRYCNWMRTT